MGYPETVGETRIGINHVLAPRRPTQQTHRSRYGHGDRGQRYGDESRRNVAHTRGQAHPGSHQHENAVTTQRPGPEEEASEESDGRGQCKVGQSQAGRVTCLVDHHCGADNQDDHKPLAGAGTSHGCTEQPDPRQSEDRFHTENRSHVPSRGAPDQPEDRPE